MTVDSEAPRITLLGRAGCHLCDEARQVIARVATETGVTWEERDISASMRDTRRYGDQVPVTFVDGVQHDFWRVDADRLRAALAAGARPRRGGDAPDGGVDRSP